MRYSGMKKGIAWDFLGWFIFVLVCLVIAIIFIVAIRGHSFNLIDKIFGK